MRVRSWIIIGTAVGLVIATASTLLAVLLPQYTAVDLRCACEQMFIGTPDNEVRFVDIGSYSALAAPAHRNGHGIQLELYRRRFGSAAASTSCCGVPSPYRPPPFVLGAGRAAHSHIVWPDIRGSPPNGSTSVDPAQLRVRVGPFTHVETIPLGREFVLTMTRACRTS